MMVNVFSISLTCSLKIFDVGLIIDGLIRTIINLVCMLVTILSFLTSLMTVF